MSLPSQSRWSRLWEAMCGAQTTMGASGAGPMSPSRCRVSCLTHVRHPIHRVCRRCVDGSVPLCRCSETAERHRWRSCRHFGPVLPHGSSREDPLCWACPQSLDHRGLWAHLHKGLVLIMRRFNSSRFRLRQSTELCKPACLQSRPQTLQKAVAQSAHSLCLQVDTPGSTLGFWHELKIHPNRPDWILAKVRRSVCEEWDASTNPWCAYDLFVSQVSSQINSYTALPP